MLCPNCESSHIVKNGRTHSGKQNFKCQDCRRQFVLEPEHQPISQETRNLVNELLLANIPLLTIVEITNVSERWLRYYIEKRTYRRSPVQLRNRITKRQHRLKTLI
jgi:transposase-like protein